MLVSFPPHSTLSIIKSFETVPKVDLTVATENVGSNPSILQITCASFVFQKSSLNKVRKHIYVFLRQINHTYHIGLPFRSTFPSFVEFPPTSSIVVSEGGVKSHINPAP